jgi:hypothetical protein
MGRCRSFYSSKRFILYPMNGMAAVSDANLHGGRSPRSPSLAHATAAKH